MRRKVIISTISAVAVAASVGALAAAHRFPVEPASAATPAVPTAPVVAGAVTSHDVPIYLQGVGTVIAYNTVIVRSQIQGQITKINFTEGQAVKTGDLLAVIDPRPYQAQLDQATANRSRDEAQLTNAQANLKRYTTLGNQGWATPQLVETQNAQVAQLQAAIKADEAMIEWAQTQLSYTQLTSPIDGVTHTTDRHRQHHPSHRPEWPRRGHATRADLDDLHAAGDEPAADSTAPSQWNTQSRGLQSGQHDEAR